MTVALRKSGKLSVKARHTVEMPTTAEIADLRGAVTSAEMARGERHTFPVQNRPGVTVEPRARDRFLAQDQSYLHLFPRLQGLFG